MMKHQPSRRFLLKEPRPLSFAWESETAASLEVGMLASGGELGSIERGAISWFVRPRGDDCAASLGLWARGGGPRRRERRRFGRAARDDGHRRLHEHLARIA